MDAINWPLIATLGLSNPNCEVKETFMEQRKSQLNEIFDDYRSKMKRKLDEKTSIEDLLEGWTKCQYFLPHKRRLCRMEISPGTVFCGNHQPLSTYVPSTVDIGSTSPMGTEENHAKEDNNTRSSRRAMKKAARGERIPCPLDPSHNIYRNNLENHLRICNESKKSTLYSSWAYYCQNCNGGEVQNAESVPDVPTDINVEEIVQKIQRIFNFIEYQLPKSVEDDDQLLASSQVAAVDERIRSEIGKDQTSFEQLRHIEQDIKIVHHMIAAGLLKVKEESEQQTSKDVFLEFGAGKGLLGYAVYFADSSASIGLVERSSNRKKIDKFLLDRHASFERYRMDIRHCMLPQLPLVIQAAENNRCEELRKCKVAVIAKHLCGVASDLAIRSLCHLPRDTFLPGLALATCCHHACQFDDYVGANWLTSFGVTREEFNIFKYWSSWASLDRTADHRKPVSNNEASVKDSEDEEGEDEHKQNVTTGREVPRPKNLDHQQLAVIGRQIKRIIDFGRLLYLKESLGISSARMIKYCDEKLSPECILLVANSM